MTTHGSRRGLPSAVAPQLNFTHRFAETDSPSEFGLKQNPGGTKGIRRAETIHLFHPEFYYLKSYLARV